MAVIHPSPQKVERRSTHKSPKSLAFDSTKASFQPRSLFKKQLPEHLTNPPIDEEKLMKIRAKEKMRQADALGRGNTKISPAAKNAEKALAKAKGELNIKIRRAEKNQKLIFTEIKKILDKHDEEVLFKGT